MPAGGCARFASSATRGSEHAFLRPPKQSSRRRGLARTHRRLLARASHRRRSIPPADPRGRGLGKAGARLAAGQPRCDDRLVRDRPRPPGQVAGPGAPQRLGRQRGRRLRHQLHRHRHQAPVDRRGRGVPRGCPCAVVGLVRGGRRRRRHRLLRPPGARLPGHAGGRRMFRAAQGTQARGRAGGAAADPAPGGRACAAHLQHDTAERQFSAGRHRVRPVGTKGRLSPDPRPSRRSGDAAARPRPGAGAGGPHRPSLPAAPSRPDPGRALARPGAGQARRARPIRRRRTGQGQGRGAVHRVRRLARPRGRRHGRGRA